MLVGDDDRIPIGYYHARGHQYRTRRIAGRACEASAALSGRARDFDRTSAIDASLQGQGHGELMLLDAFSRALRIEIASYAFVVDAKDDKAARFNQRYRFRSLVEGGQRLFVPMVEIIVFVALAGRRSVDFPSPGRGLRRLARLAEAG